MLPQSHKAIYLISNISVRVRNNTWLRWYRVFLIHMLNLTWHIEGWHQSCSLIVRVPHFHLHAQMKHIIIFWAFNPWQNLPNKLKWAVEFNYVSSVLTTCWCSYSCPVCCFRHQPIRSHLSPSKGPFWSWFTHHINTLQTNILWRAFSLFHLDFTDAMWRAFTN